MLLGGDPATSSDGLFIIGAFILSDLFATFSAFSINIFGVDKGFSLSACFIY